MPRESTLGDSASCGLDAPEESLTQPLSRQNNVSHQVWLLRPEGTHQVTARRSTFNCAPPIANVLPDTAKGAFSLGRIYRCESIIEAQTVPAAYEENCAHRHVHQRNHRYSRRASGLTLTDGSRHQIQAQLQRSQKCSGPPRTPRSQVAGTTPLG